MSIDVLSTRQSLATQYGSLAGFASLHTADPGSTGASELTGGTPAYARKAITWSAPDANGAITGTVTFDVGAGKTVTFGGLWSAATAGTYRDGEALPAGGQVFNTQGQYIWTVTFTQT